MTEKCLKLGKSNENAVQEKESIEKLCLILLLWCIQLGHLIKKPFSLFDVWEEKF